MQKTINVIIYPPGFAGNFLTLILSLDKRTFPWVPVGSTLETEDQRKHFYSFSSLQDRNNAWQGHHVQFFPRFGEFMKSVEYDTMIWRMHPSHYYEFFDDILYHTSNTDTKINFLSVHASPEVEYEHVVKFNQRNKLKFLGQENTKLELFLKDHKTFKILLDRLFTTEEDFVKEYERINAFLGLENHHEDALWLYRDWRKARETDRSEAADKYTKDLLFKQLKTVLQYRSMLTSEWYINNKEVLSKKRRSRL